ncbi:unnamed protein product [Effrenium voratum]|nr:unnamed protein product [Effrenium voratum]
MSADGGTGSAVVSEKVKAIFKRYDLNQDGCINRQELWTVLSALCPTLSEPEVDKIFERMDVNKDQRIQFSEFVDFVFGFADLSDEAEMKMREATETMDANIRPAPASGLYRVGSEARAPKLTRDLSDLTFDLEGGEPDLPQLLQSLQLLNTQALREVFQQADVSKRGFLRLGDLRRLLFPENVQSTDNSMAVVKVFAQMDKNGDGKIHSAEFVSFVIGAKRRISTTASDADKRVMANAFSHADADSDGRISMEEFEHLFGANTDFDRRMLQSVFDSVDKNQDGCVSMVELARVYGKELLQDAKGIQVAGSMDAGDEESEDDF